MGLAAANSSLSDAGAKPGRTLQKAGPMLAAIGFLVGLGAIGYWMLFSNLALYDDEGYILISARDYFLHGGLYESVYSQYGPAFFVLSDLFQHLTGAPIDHTSARLLTLGLWLATAAGCAGLVRRQTASHLLAAFTLAGTFLYLYFITDEPFHPGSLIIGLLALTVWAEVELIEARRLAAAGLVAGAMGALLALTKINVGAFYVVGLLAWGVLNAGSDRGRRIAQAGVVAGLVLFVVALMHTLWRESWIQLYLTVFAIGALTLVLAVPAEPRVGVRHAGCFVLGAAAAAVAILGAVWVRGTSVAGLVEGVLLGPLHHPGNYSYPVDWRPGTLEVAVLSLALALALPWIRRRFSVEAADRLIVGVRLIQLAGLLVGLALLMNFRSVGAIFSYVAPLIWTWVIPLRSVGRSRPNQACRGLLGIVLLVQYLHAYPIGGSQESWATFLFIPLVALGLAEIGAWCAPQPNARWRWWPVVVALAAGVMATKTAWTAAAMHRRYAARSDLGLPGASHLHLPENQSSAYRLLALNAVVHGDRLFSLPGMFSFNLWTDLPTPTRKNTTLWFTLLSDPEQAAIIESLEHSSRACVIVQQSLVQLMRAGNVPMRGILHDFVRQNFSPAFQIEGFTFMVRNGRTIAPLGVGRVSLWPAAAPAQPDTRLDVCLESDGTPIVAIEAIDLASPARPLLTLDGTATRVAFTATNSAGRPNGAPASMPWPLGFKGIGRLSFRFNRGAVVLAPDAVGFRLKGSEGQILGEIRLNE